MHIFSKEVENFEEKSKKLISKILEIKNNFQQEIFEIEKICDSIGIANDELHGLIYHLKKGEILETDSNNRFGKLTLYGELLHKGEIKIGLAPFI